MKELQSIADYETFSPAVAPAFNNCVAGCTVLKGSCTATNRSYWSSTSVAAVPDRAWVVFLGIGFVSGDDKDNSSDPVVVRAVRGGCVD